MNKGGGVAKNVEAEKERKEPKWFGRNTRKSLGAPAKKIHRVGLDVG